MSAQRSVVSSAKLIAACTLISRVTGLVRDILLAQAFGLAWVQDAWVYAFQVPNLFRRLFGEGAMAAAFVPTFTRTLENEGRAAAWGLMARTLALLTVALCVMIVMIGLLLALVWALTPADAEIAEPRGLLLGLTALMLPFLLTVCVLALLSSILNCLGSFVPPALTPLVLNVCMIVGIGWLAPTLYPDDDHAQAFVLALTVVAAGVLQLVLIWPVLRAHGVELGWHWDTRDPAVRRMLRLVVPVLLGQGVLAFGVFLDAQICILLTHKAGTPATADLFGMTFHYPLQEGALGAVTYATRLYQFPLGVLVISLATAALPAFSRLANRQAWVDWTREVRQAFRLAVFEGVLAGAMMIVLAEPIVRLLFERGDFTAEDTVRAGRILRLYGFGLWAFCAQHIVLRGFYSLHDVRTPLKISVAVLPLGVLMNLSLVWLDSVREAAFAISLCTTSTISVVVGLFILRQRVAQPIVDRTSAMALVRVVIAGVAAGLVVVLVRPAWAHVVLATPTGVLRNAVETLGLLAIGSGAYLLCAGLMRLPEARLINPLAIRRRGQ